MRLAWGTYSLLHCVPEQVVLVPIGPKVAQRALRNDGHLALIGKHQDADDDLQYEQ